MQRIRFSSEDERRIRRAVMHFKARRHDFQYLAKNVFTLLSEHPKLIPLIHSMKWRVKDLSHLRHKLIRKTLKTHDGDPKERVPITAENLYERIEDLAGVRILHLHTQQMKAINSTVLSILRGQQWLVEGPIANTWDDEYRSFFKKIGITTTSRESLYTSVHYILRPNSQSPLRCELQVRTLAEEVWGEVSHTIDYPDPTQSIACKEQLKVLARITSGCIRLVDSIFESEKEYKKHFRTSQLI